MAADHRSLAAHLAVANAWLCERPTGALAQRLVAFIAEALGAHRVELADGPSLLALAAGGWRHLDPAEAGALAVTIEATRQGAAEAVGSHCDARIRIEALRAHTVAGAEGSALGALNTRRALRIVIGWCTRDTGLAFDLDETMRSYLADAFEDHAPAEARPAALARNLDEALAGDNPLAALKAAAHQIGSMTEASA